MKRWENRIRIFIIILNQLLCFGFIGWYLWISLGDISARYRSGLEMFDIIILLVFFSVSVADIILAKKTAGLLYHVMLFQVAVLPLMGFYVVWYFEWLVWAVGIIFPGILIVFENYCNREEYKKLRQKKQRYRKKYPGREFGDILSKVFIIICIILIIIGVVLSATLDGYGELVNDRDFQYDNDAEMEFLKYMMCFPYVSMMLALVDIKKAGISFLIYTPFMLYSCFNYKLYSDNPEALRYRNILFGIDYTAAAFIALNFWAAIAVILYDRKFRRRC